MTVLILFASTFIVVFALGAQSLLVNNGKYIAAFGNSLVIGTCNLLLFKLAPDANTPEIAAFLSGGPFGIVAAMYTFRHLHRQPSSKTRKQVNRQKAIDPRAMP
jgi:hypothetical protein